MQEEEDREPLPSPKYPQPSIIQTVVVRSCLNIAGDRIVTILLLIANNVKHVATAIWFKET